MDNRARSIVAGIEAFGKFLAEKDTQDKGRDAINGRLDGIETKLSDLSEINDHLQALEDKEIQRERPEKWPEFARLLMLKSEIRSAIQDGFSRHLTPNQIEHNIRRVAKDLENFFERR